MSRAIVLLPVFLSQSRLLRLHDFELSFQLAKRNSPASVGSSSWVHDSSCDVFVGFMDSQNVRLSLKQIASRIVIDRAEIRRQLSLVVS